MWYRVRICACIFINTWIFINLFIVVVFMVLKKHYTTLCRSLPQDRIKTINKIKELIQPSDKILLDLIRLSTVELTNEAIIGLLIRGIKTDIDTLDFCDVMEVLVDSEQLKVSVELLRNGK